MTYSNSLQGHFVVGKHTPLLLLFFSVVLWGCALFLLPRPSHVIVWAGNSAALSGGFFLTLLPPLCCVAVALMLNYVHMNDRRISWRAPLYLFLTAVSAAFHYNSTVSLAALFFMLLMRALLECQPGEGAEGALFAAFALLGLFALLLPQMLFLLPLFVIYMLVVNLSGARRWLSALLGLIMPFWFLFGVLYVCPDFAGYVPSVSSVSEDLSLGDFSEVTPLRLLLAVAELGIMLPAIVLFATSLVPGKPHLRRRMLFVMLSNCLIFVLSWFSEANYELLYAWRLPGVAIMAAYLFTVKLTRLTNVYFIFIMVFWLAIGVFGLWTD